MKEIQRVGITVRREAATKALLLDVIRSLQENSKQVYLLESAVTELKDEKIEVPSIQELDPKIALDLLIVLGGDGTILSAVRKLQSLQTYILGINAGNLGFLSEIAPSDFSGNCFKIWEENYTLDERLVLSVEVRKKNGNIKTYRALNEAVVSQAAVARLVEIPTRIDDLELAVFRADGLIIATPTGSTAYNLSAGGPILHPRVEALILTPIAPFSFSQKPLVIPAEKTITLDITECSREGTALTLDGQVNEPLECGDVITISRFPETAKFLRLPEESYFKTLRSKLKWGERL